MSTRRGWRRAGTVASPHGLDGSFRVAQPAAELLRLGTVVELTGRERRIVRRAGTDLQPIVRLEGCENRTQARALRGATMLVAAVDAQLGPDEWWAEDLEGCSVHDARRQIGVVSRLLALPSCEVLEVRRTGGGPDLLVPLVRDAVRGVDLSARRIDVDSKFLGEDPRT